MMLRKRLLRPENLSTLWDLVGPLGFEPRTNRLLRPVRNVAIATPGTSMTEKSTLWLIPSSLADEIQQSRKPAVKTPLRCKSKTLSLMQSSTSRFLQAKFFRAQVPLRFAVSEVQSPLRRRCRRFGLCLRTELPRCFCKQRFLDRWHVVLLGIGSHPTVRSSQSHSPGSADRTR